MSDVGGLADSNAALFAEDGASRDQLRNPRWPGSHGTQWCADLITDPAALVLVVAVGVDVVGHLVGTLANASAMWTGSRAELVSMFVSSSWRGQGVGGRLVDEFVVWARERGASRLQVSAYVSNGSAIRLYRRYGFAPLSMQLVMDV